eukprot:GFKZ01003336.1.p1 GENE.GFKZ01003336.1~~GFKZ01003336.1.p1  ORF type:complete len:604 (+),score=85.13 GFKZ01003336.1:246-1814(+)
MSAAVISTLRSGRLSWQIAISLSILFTLLYPFRAPPPSIPSFSQPSTSPPSPPSYTRPDDVLGPELHTRIHQLARFSAPCENGAAGVNRPFLSVAAEQARQVLMSYMADAGLDAHVDGAGNVISTLTCTSSPGRRALALGSHFDSVRGGGVWDGTYGVLAAIAVAKVISRRPAGVCALPFDLLVVAFDDEEGNNSFGSTNFGSKAFAGVLDIEKDVGDFAELARQYALIFPQVKKGKGGLEDRVANRVASAAVEADKLLGFLEVHIEQGPVLERKGLSVGVVDAIAGQTRLAVTIRGQSGHAGTVPMDGRTDALAAAAEAVSVVERVGKEGGDGLVATVGRLQVQPGSTNVIAGLVRFSVDVRAPEDGTRIAAVEEIVSTVRRMEGERGVEVSFEKTHEVGAVSMTPWIRETLEGLEVRGTGVWEAACFGKMGTENCSASYEGRDGGVESVKMTTLTSGAGHDTQFVSKVTDVGMLFIRCKGGVSHHVDEHVDESDSYHGARTLLKAVESMALRVEKLTEQM